MSNAEINAENKTLPVTDMIRTKVPLDMEEAEKSLQEKAYNLHGNKSLNLLDQGAMLRGLADQKVHIMTSLVTDGLRNWVLTTSFARHYSKHMMPEFMTLLP